MNEQNAMQTPIVDLLRAIPFDARMEYEYSPCHHRLIPVGRHAKEAANRIESLERDLAAAKADADVWRHIAQEQYAAFRRECDPKETGYAIEGALDALFRGYREHGRYAKVFCSQCGCEFPSNFHGYSHCSDHSQAAIDAALAKVPS